MIDFQRYHAENPDIYKEFVRFAKLTKEKGFKNYSANGIFELIRWHTPLTAKGDQFKINNNFRPDYARKMMDEYPEFFGFFRCREIKAERV